MGLTAIWLIDITDADVEKIDLWLARYSVPRRLADHAPFWRTARHIVVSRYGPPRSVVKRVEGVLGHGFRWHCIIADGKPLDAPTEDRRVQRRYEVTSRSRA
jgi:hypothetical protein